MSQQFFQQDDDKGSLSLNEGNNVYQAQFDTYSAQKLTSPPKTNAPTANQCQILALISIGLWMLAFTFATGFVTYTRLQLGMHYVMAFCLFLLMILLIVINSAFNRGRAADPDENPTSEQRMNVAVISLLAWLVIAVGGGCFVIGWLQPWLRGGAGIFILGGLLLFTILLSALNLSFNRSRRVR